MCILGGRQFVAGRPFHHAGQRDASARQRVRVRGRRDDGHAGPLVGGELIWCWAVKPDYVLPESDPDYRVFPGDPSLGVFSRFINSS